MSKLQVKNEAVISAPINSIWAIITDIDLLPKVNPGVVKATGRMDKEGETRTVEININGKNGTFTEKLIELVPEKKTVWTIENDTMGMSKMLKDNRFIFNLEKLPDNKTKVSIETYYQSANFIAKIMSALMIKRTFGKMQENMLSNIKTLSEQ
ncbi:MAG: SRPBCC family protein [Flavobacteriaceae bacterium]|jgi:carbon monoxide dehydrogenase subunit G|nr:SRPBCC family protein [Flavobacteriaceae bacterium]